MTIRTLGGEVVRFEGVERQRGKFTLPATGGKPERGVGGLRVRVDSTPEIARLRWTIPRRLKRQIRIELRRSGRRR